MKKLTLILILFLVIVVCTSGRASGQSKKEIIEQDVLRVEEMTSRFEQINKSMIDRGYLEVAELEELLKQKKCDYDPKHHAFPSVPGSDCVTTYWPKFGCPAWIENVSWTPPVAFETVYTAADKDYLSFKGMFYLALQKGDYDEAENIKIIWVDYLNRIADFLKGYHYYYNAKTGKTIMSVRELVYSSDNTNYMTGRQYVIAISKEKDRDVLPIVKKVDAQVQKLTSVVGLADPMLVSLRKELAVAIKNKKWDDAQKIQNIITARTNELRPPQPQTTVGSSSQTTIVIQQPSEQHIKVERVPRYGAEDVGRAMSLLQGRGGSLTSQEAGTLKLLDIIMGR